jgi:hypothetical protein
MGFGTREPAFHERKRDGLNFIKSIERPNEKAAIIPPGTGALREHVPLESPES